MIFKILNHSSEELLVETFSCCKNEKISLKKQLKNTEDKLKECLGENSANVVIAEAIRASERAFRQETEKKQNKLDRDTTEKVELEKGLGKKKKNRRFRRRRPKTENNNEHTDDNNNNTIEPNNLEAKVKNSSSRELTEHEQKLLELGPKFCLVEHDIKRGKLQKDLKDETG